MNNSKILIAGFALLLPAFAAAQVQSTATNSATAPAPAAMAAPAAPALPPSNEDAGRKPKERPCMADMAKFCKDVQGGSGERMKCLKAHEADLSAACKARIANAKKETGGDRPCLEDMEKLCKDVKGGPGEKMKCLKAHASELSQACKDKLSRGPGKREKPDGTKPETK